MVKQNKEDFLQEEIEEEQIRVEKDEKIAKITIIITGIIFVILIANIFYINYNLRSEEKVTENIQVPTKVSTISPTTTPKPKNLSPLPTTTQSTTSMATSLKDYFISFGSGNSKSQNWVDVGGLQATVDLTGYGDIKEIRLEISIQVPEENQWVSVRIYNKTDNHPVWNSEVTKSAGAKSYIVSGPIVYDKGSKTYTVQMKTQLGSTVTLGEARFHIVLR